MEKHKHAVRSLSADRLYDGKEVHEFLRALGSGTVLVSVGVVVATLSLGLGGFCFE